MTRVALACLAADDLGWAVKGLQRYVGHRRVDADFLRLLAVSSAPGELIEPGDPVYGQQVFDTMLAALENRIAARQRARSYERAENRTKALISQHIPACGAMMEALEELEIGYEVIRLTIDGEDHFTGSGGNT